MPYNGTTGVYTAPALPGSWNPATSGSTASPTDWNTLLADFVTAYTTAICKDGQTTPTANLPMGGFKHTGVGNATARDSYAAAGQVQDGSLVYVAAGGTADAITLTLSPAVTAYAIGQTFQFKAASDNATTTPTLNVNGVGAGTITWPDGSALRAADIKSGGIFEVSVQATTPVFHLKTVASPPLNASLGLTKANNLSDVASVATSRINLKVDQRTTAADTSPTIAASATYVAYTSITAARTVTLPAASTVNAGSILTIADESGSASSTNTISLAPNGTDTIDGSNTTQVVINIPRGSAVFVCDGSSKWTPLKFSVVYINTLGADVTVNNTGAYFTGPSVAQGTVGRWMASGQITAYDTSGGSNWNAKLWDGTSLIDSGRQQSTAANAPIVIAQSGYIASPAGNIRMSGQDASTTNGVMLFNASGNSKDCTLTVWRVP